MTLTDKNPNNNNAEHTMTDDQVEDTLTLMKSEIEEADRVAQKYAHKHHAKHQK
jgi:hypothetical protein